MRTKLIIIVVLVYLLSIYFAVFLTASIYTKPTKEEAIYKVTNFFSTYYASSIDAWKPFANYHTTFPDGYYSRDWLGRWKFHTEILKLKGEVVISNDVDR